REKSERRVQRRLVGREVRQCAIELRDRVSFVETENFAGSVRAVTKAIPDFALLVLFAAEQDVTIGVGTVGARDERDHGLRLGKTRDVMEIAVVTNWIESSA